MSLKYKTFSNNKKNTHQFCLEKMRLARLVATLEESIARYGVSNHLSHEHELIPSLIKQVSEIPKPSLGSYVCAMFPPQTITIVIMQIVNPKTCGGEISR